MKRLLKYASKLALVAVIAVMMFAMTGCTAVQISANIVFNEDGSGSRTITASIAKNDLQDGYGSAYYYVKQHGDALAQYLKTAYTASVAGSDQWLDISVDDSGSDWEVINLKFDFTSFDDYTTKLASLAYDKTAAATYAAPELKTNDDGTVTYTESAAALTAIFKSMQTTIMADDTMFDVNSTKDGKATNDGSADLKSLTDYGVELMKPENGNAMTVQFGTGEATPVANTDGVFTVTGNYSGAAIVKEEHKTTNVLDYGFNGDLKNAGTAADNDLTYGTGSTDGGPVFVEGIDGQAIKLDGNTYLASPNKTYGYDEMTVSFYYKMDSYTQTDTGANMIIVPAGLGALGAGVIDLEFIKDGDAEGVQLLAKMNSSDWQTQDKLYSDGYFMDVHLNEWHNYTLVYQNEYDDQGNINDAFVYMYIDGQLATKARLSVAAGLTYSLGMFDDGSAGAANGGFNVGGYYENATVKRAATGTLDSLKVFDGALTQDDINSLCYTTAVEKPYDPTVVDVVNGDNTSAVTAAPTAAAAPTTAPTAAPVTAPAESSRGSNTTVIIIIIVAVVVIAAVAAGVVLSKKKKK